MKKWIAMACALVLMLSMTAFAAQGDAILAHDMEGVYISGIFVGGDVLYLHGGDCLYTWQVGQSGLTKYEWDGDLSAFAEEGEEVRAYDPIVFADGETLYAIHMIYGVGEQETINGAVFSRVVLDPAGKATFEDSRRVEWPEELVETGEGYASAKNLQNLFAQNGKMYFSVYGQMGEQIYAMDMETMALEALPFQNPDVFVPYSEGRILVKSYSSGSMGYELVAYDCESGQSQTLCTFEENISGFAADLQSGAIYCVSGGAVCQIDPQTGEIGEPLTDMPLTVYMNIPGWILEGQYYVYNANEGVVVRNTRPEQRASRQLKVVDGTWLDPLMDAYFDFTNAHGDVSVMISRDYADRENIIEDMMNRDSSVDLYILSTTESAYSALLERGFMAELDGSEKLTKMVQDTYPSLLKQLTRDGKLVAVPVQASCWMVSVNEQALKKIGLTLDDVPDNWSDFLDFLADELPKHLTPGCGVSLFYEEMTAQDVRRQLFDQIFNDYQAYADATMETPSFDTPLLRSLLEKLERIDFAALGYEEAPQQGAAASVMVFSSGDSSQLFDFYTGASFGNFYSENKPLLMSMDAQSPKIMTLDMDVAFVNPFSENLDLAIELLENLCDRLPQTTLYNLSPNLNEPVRRPGAEESLRDAQDNYDSVKKQYDEAEPVDRQVLEESLKDAEQWLEYAERDSWLISQEQIDWVRANDDNLMPRSASWLYRDASGDAYELVQQYLDRQISAAQFLQNVDKKVRMMQMEGM